VIVDPEAAVPAPLAEAADAAERAGIRRVRAVGWRDLDHDDAGGSEIHLDEVLSRWAAAGLDVSLRTARVPAAPRAVRRRGYAVERRGGPVTSLVRTPLAERRAPGDAVVEAWHGINFCGPLWIDGPRLAIVHHVHAPEFHYVLPRPAAWLARRHEGTVSPRLYRRTPIVALSPSVRDELVALGYRPAGITVVTPGVSERFSPGGGRCPTPRILTVCRLWPIKQVDVLIRAVAALRARHPDVELVVVGEGPCRPQLDELVRDLRAPVRFLGRVDEATLVALYRSAWVLASASAGEGWGMTLTEAAACGTPAVVADNTGHRHAVVDGVTGLLARGQAGLTAGLDRLLGDPVERARLGRAARARAVELSWDRTAAAMLDVLVADAIGRAPGARLIAPVTRGRRWCASAPPAP
jgi:glycosyltransferase involved in cell wall biosynthesis